MKKIYLATLSITTFLASTSFANACVFGSLALGLDPYYYGPLTMIGELAPFLAALSV